MRGAAGEARFPMQTKGTLETPASSPQPIDPRTRRLRHAAGAGMAGDLQFSLAVPLENSSSEEALGDTTAVLIVHSPRSRKKRGGAPTHRRRNGVLPPPPAGDQAAAALPATNAALSYTSSQARRASAARVAPSPPCMR